MSPREDITFPCQCGGCAERRRRHVRFAGGRQCGHHAATGSGAAAGRERDYTSIVPQDDAQIVANRFRHYDARQLTEAAAARPLLFPPGTKWSYSDTNYLVAGLLVTAVTGRSWNSEVTGRIIWPLRLSGTSAPGDDPFIPGPHADGYVMVGGRPADITVWNPSVAGSAGAVISTTAGLDRFLTALLGGNSSRPPNSRRCRPPIRSPAPTASACS
jgi:CubicO group peptidase (beta-lactamase class C family)